MLCVSADLDSALTHEQLAYIICGILVYGVIIIFDDAETIQSIGKHVSTEMVSEGHSSEGHSTNLVLFEQKVTRSGSKSILIVVWDSDLTQKNSN